MNSSRRSDFPIFSNNPDLVYLDSASTAQKPEMVISAISEYLRNDYSNIHRGAYELSENSEKLYQDSKIAIAELIGAGSRYEVVYSSNATGAFNLLASSFAESTWLTSGDRVILSIMEHHANIVPWMILKERIGIEVVFVGIVPEAFELDMDDFREKLTPNTKVISFTGCSNVTGVGVDFAVISREVTSLWKAEWGKAPLKIIDASQLVPHRKLDVVELGVDFAIFTGHKMGADTGIGILWGKKELLKALTPSVGGGGAINFVNTETFEPAGLPFRFEPGTPNLSGAVSLGAACKYLQSIGGYSEIATQEQLLIRLVLGEFDKRKDFLSLIGPDLAEFEKNSQPGHSVRCGVFSFVFSGMHANDVADALAEQGICVRAGHHCTEPLHTSLGLSGTVRASLGVYSTEEDVMKLFDALDVLWKEINTVGGDGEG